MNIGKFISIIHRKRQQYIKEELKKLNLDIGISDYPIILVLNARGKLGTTEIAKTYVMTKAQVSQSVRKLEQLGYIIQNRDEKCRSKVYIEITSKGKEIANKLRTIQKNWQEKEAIKNLTIEDIEKFYEVLTVIASSVCGDDINSLL